MPLASIGLDFGTTNTVLAHSPDGERVNAMTFNHLGEPFSACRSVLCFWLQQGRGPDAMETEIGPWAVDQFISFPDDSRFIQSFKTFAASSLFQHTRVFAKRCAFEDLLATFLAHLLNHAGEGEERLPQRVVIGRPVRFAGQRPDEALAVERYLTALRRLGAEDIRFVYEPVAAAFYFVRRMRRDCTVLVADFGGGTSDFSLMRFERQGGRFTARALATSGVGIAGDRFDFQIIDRLISPLLGKGSHYVTMGKRLEMPSHFYASFARWNELSLMRGSDTFRDLKQLARLSEEPACINQFIELIEANLGYALYQAVSQAKTALSGAEEAELHFAAGGLDLKTTIRRSDFDDWIADDIAQMEGALDEALCAARIEAGEVDKVFLTGGTSFVPRVRRLFEERFGAEKIETGDELISIAHGLSLIAARDDIDQWCVAAPL